mgnify:CR=1 FL=1
MTEPANKTAETRPAGTAKRKRRSDALANRELLLQAAFELVSEGGPDGLTVVAVARRAGLNRSTAYQHFRDRDELADAVNESFAERFRNLSLEPRPIGEHFDFFVEHFQRNPEIARMWIYKLLQGDGTPAAQFNSGAINRLADSHRGQDDIDAEMLAMIVTSATMVWSLTANRADTDDATRAREAARFSRELKRLFLFGALRPEKWPNLAAELSED